MFCRSCVSLTINSSLLSYFAMANVQHAIRVAQFQNSNKRNPELPYHWAILLLDTRYDAWVYQIEGFPGNYNLAPVVFKQGFNRSGKYKG